jgi:phosphoserine phosphatase RsbU/P
VPPRAASYTGRPGLFTQQKTAVKSSPNASPSRTLGLLADRFDEPYQQAILSTMEEATQQRATNLLAFAGGIPGSILRGSDRRSLMFDLVSEKSVDGVILLAGTMVNELGVEGLAGFLRRIEGLPLCAIGVEVPGVPSLLVDNDAGVHQAMRHLVDHHGSRRIGFVRGPARNKEAEVRFSAYRAAMDKAGLSQEEDLVFQGNFLRPAGEAAVAHWRSRGAIPDAILCANDEMALGVLEALVRAGVRVPEDVRVVGFDGVEVARLSNPPLTTVRQPLSDLAVSAVRTVMDQLQGRKVPELQTLGTHLVVRESCGCVLQLTSTGQNQFAEEGSGAEPGVSSREGFAAAFQRFRQPLQAELARVARGEFAALGAWDVQLFEAFISQLSNQTNKFVQDLGQLVSKLANAGGEVSRFQDVITAFRRFALPCCGEDHKLRTQVENILQEVRLLVAHAAERVQGQRQLELTRFALTLSEVGAALTASFDLAELARVACQKLPRLGVTAFCLAVYEPFTTAQRHTGLQLPQRSRLVAAFDQSEALVIDQPQATFATDEVAPAPFNTHSKTRQMTALSLYLKGENLGFCLVQCRGGNGAVIEMLREQLSIALYGCRGAR